MPTRRRADEPPEFERFRPLSGRRRLLILVLAVVTAITVVLTLLHPPGGVERKRHLPAPCAPGQTEGCVGGKAEVLPAAPASR